MSRSSSRPQSHPLDLLMSAGVPVRVAKPSSTNAPSPHPTRRQASIRAASRCCWRRPRLWRARRRPEVPGRWARTRPSRWAQTPYTSQRAGWTRPRNCGGLSGRTHTLHSPRGPGCRRPHQGAVRSHGAAGHARPDRRHDRAISGCGGEPRTGQRGRLSAGTRRHSTLQAGRRRPQHDPRLPLLPCSIGFGIFVLVAS